MGLTLNESATVSSRFVTRLAADGRSGLVRPAACPARLADGRTALPHHRRRLAGQRRPRRSVRAFLVTTVIAAAAVMGGAKYALSHFSSQPNSLAAAIEGLQSSGPAAALVAQRQHLILMAVATKSFKVFGSKVASAPQPAGGGGGGGGIIYGPPPSQGSLQAIAYKMLPGFGFNSKSQFPCVNAIFTRESNWNPYAANASGAYGIPQALPGWKMSSQGPNWQTNPTTQIRWGIWYMKTTYGSPCNAWTFWQAHNYY